MNSFASEGFCTVSQPSVSVIIPVLNESGLIRSCLERVRFVAPGCEIIVVDGGSNDGTVELCLGLADHVLKTLPGRARQMNAGAVVAQADVLWFVHADSIIPTLAFEEIARVLEERTNAGGCFRLRLPSRQRMYRRS